MFTNKTGFGTTTTFGSGSFGSAAPFGQNTSAFGANKPLGTGFGTPQFGSAAPNTSIFSGSGTSSGGIFGGNTSTFGQAGTSTSSFGFTSGTNTGTGLFGSTTQPNAGSSIFQSPAPSAFGAPKTTFGGFGTTGSTGLFGQTPQQSTSLFGQSTSTGTGTGLFGNSGSTFSAFGTTTGPNGTTVKFNPVTGTDTMSKNGVTNAISIRHQCITVMKEYESKSLEELRMEDYLANRKGPQQSTLGTFGGGQSSLFGPSTSTASTGLFGSTQNKPLFGTPTNAFGTSTSSGGLFGQTNQTQSNSLFNKPLGFGTPTTTSSVFSFGTNQSTSVFGGSANQAKPLFGNQTTGTGIFGANNPLQTSIGFGTGTTGFGSTLGTTNQSTTLPFGSKAPFGATTTSSFSFGGPSNTTTGSSIFGAKPAGTTNTIFGTTNTFGTAGPTFGSFGNTANTGSSFFSMNKPATTFGIGTGTNCFGTGLGTTNTNMNSLFGNNANKSGSLMMGSNFLGTGNTGRPSDDQKDPDSLSSLDNEEGSTRKERTFVSRNKKKSPKLLKPLTIMSSVCNTKKEYPNSTIPEHDIFIVNFSPEAVPEKETFEVSSFQFREQTFSKNPTEILKSESEISSASSELKLSIAHRNKLLQMEPIDGKTETKDISTITELTMKDLDVFENEGKLCQMKPTECPRSLNFEAVLKRYTGLPSVETFTIILKIFSIQKTEFKTLLSFEDQLLLCLLKLRLSLQYSELALKFSLPCSLVSTVFLKCLTILARGLKPMIKWPSKSCVRKNAPKILKETGYSSVKCIICWFTVHYRKSSYRPCKAVTLSNCSIKYVLGITPKGYICFLSRAWRNHVKEEVIIQKSGFLDFLNPGDSVVVDDNFKVKELLVKKNVNVLSPPCKKHLTKLEKVDKLAAKEVLKVKANVEKTLRKIRSYQILSARVTAELLKYEFPKKLRSLDKILIVCCAVNNLSRLSEKQTIALFKYLNDS